MEESNAELESFRQKWREEVSAKSKAGGNHEVPPTAKSAGTSKVRGPGAPRKPSDKASREDEDHFEPRDLSELNRSSSSVVPGGGESSKQSSREPRSALEYYEKAVEKENQGSLGNSLDLYRKAFKLDHKVEQKYKSKHFPPSFASKSTNSVPAKATTESNTAQQPEEIIPQTINQLIAGFSGLSIEPAPPAVEGTPALSCPLATLPGEIMVHIFMEVAKLDVSTFVRLAQVCKHMAFIVATEESIWKSICQGSEVGFGGMHYQWQREVLGGPLENDTLEFDDDSDGAVVDPQKVALELKETITDVLLREVYKSWHHMFRARPRVRFNGCYISTNNYIRPGQAEANRLTWNNPVHIVTYYRYLRLFRDGTVISLLTTSEPADVVHHITKELLTTHQNNASLHLPSAVMQNALKGRWRLSPVNENPDADLKDAEGDLCVETEGVGPQYIYRMDLTLRNAGKKVRNNKLVWREFWSYNKLTDDWAEFVRRNEKPLFWSRVKSYGRGA